MLLTLRAEDAIIRGITGTVYDCSFVCKTQLVLHVKTSHPDFDAAVLLVAPLLIVDRRLAIWTNAVARWYDTDAFLSVKKQSRRREGLLRNHCVKRASVLVRVCAWCNSKRQSWAIAKPLIASIIWKLKTENVHGHKGRKCVMWQLAKDQVYVVLRGKLVMWVVDK